MGTAQEHRQKYSQWVGPMDIEDMSTESIEKYLERRKEQAKHLWTPEEMECAARMFDFLCDGFSWKKSKKGVQYWSEVLGNLYEISQGRGHK